MKQKIDFEEFRKSQTNGIEKLENSDLFEIRGGNESETEPCDCLIVAWCGGCVNSMPPEIT